MTEAKKGSRTTAVKPATQTKATATKAPAPAKRAGGTKPAPARAPAAVKPAAKAKTAAPAKAARPRARKAAVSPDQRRNYIEVAAYYIAAGRGFAPGDPLQDWIQAEAEIDRLLGEGRLGLLGD